VLQGSNHFVWFGPSPPLALTSRHGLIEPIQHGDAPVQVCHVDPLYAIEPVPLCLLMSGNGAERAVHLGYQIGGAG
jgi:hypothetical protein